MKKYRSKIAALSMMDKRKGSMRSVNSEPALPKETLPVEEALPEEPEVSPALRAAAEKLGEQLPTPVPLTSDDSHRTKIAKEILSTEITYCHTLETIISLYLHALKGAAVTEKRITPPMLQTIFGNIELIYSLNSELLNELHNKVKEWDDASTCIGDIFLKIGAFLKLYAQYSNSYEQAMNVYQNEMESNPAFCAVVEECNRATNTDTRLHHLLIQPVQRVPRYVLLLQDLVKKTGDDHPDRQQLEKALSEIKTVTSHINESVRATERSRTLAGLASKGIPVETLLEPHRHLVAGDLHNVLLKGGGNPSKRYLMIFNDIFVHVSKNKCKKAAELQSPENHWPLSLVWSEVHGQNVEIKGAPSSFQVVFAVRLWAMPKGKRNRLEKRKGKRKREVMKERGERNRKIGEGRRGGKKKKKKGMRKKGKIC
eukprot:TRINITY_DN2487_c0_g2_i3.p1 TRINITY_DN2487_c0_g2~~TRINITY_DN2487_c0_g2_i3.p1  ORF type:complete len:462 (-),score=132.77 TRINITY_DN2487_c0_g2_i3:52-1332(-)